MLLAITIIWSKAAFALRNTLITTATLVKQQNSPGRCARGRVAVAKGGGGGCVTGAGSYAGGLGVHQGKMQPPNSAPNVAPEKAPEP